MSNKFGHSPKLLENISFANFSKFTIFTKGKNEDIAKDSEKLKFSLNYIKKDLEILKPDIIVIPDTIYNKHSKIQKLIGRFTGKTNQNFYAVYTYLEDVIKRIGL